MQVFKGLIAIFFSGKNRTSDRILLDFLVKCKNRRNFTGGFCAIQASVPC
ncbi:hypothetical protein HM1_0381 [Heliomicrobium modesticaldum Ice1]|uniref:Uncharacterized protein n=1 Tax=Heliobacterium modesticaldum (strain ATCC 51547 / Ice1) TaxID=498761 RepID=B0TF17_HELMI|nr:hypothetical protein HM1_0381 [Heliomicrobium modesticaldum Ice1]